MVKVKACFVYGSLRPDDDSGMPWTQQACEGMTWRKAMVKDTQLFKDDYACAVLNRPGHQVLGCVLTHEDDLVFAEKIIYYDQIEGYDSLNPMSGYYQRDERTAYIVDADNKETGETIECYIYHRSNINENKPIESGDWMKRDRSDEARPEQIDIEFTHII